MKCQQLAARIEKLQPDASAIDVARMTLIVQTQVAEERELESDSNLAKLCRDAQLRLEHASDQHAAVTEELEALAESDPRNFNPDDIWILIRAIKVQNQILQLYATGCAIDV